MCQPQLPCTCTKREIRRLIKCHMFIFSGLLHLVRFPVHPLTDKKICRRRISYNAFGGSGIRAVRDFNPFSGFSQHHIRCKYLSFFFYYLTFLQTIPVFSWNLHLVGSFHIKSADAFHHDIISIADHVVIDPESFNMKALKGNGLLRLRKLLAVNLKRQFRRNYPQRIDYFGQTFGAYQQQWFRTLCIAHGKEHPRQTADMIRMKMGEADDINGLRTPPLFFHGNLRSLSAVYQYTDALIPRHQRSKPSVRQRHHPSCTK